jgi:hypothetical protein
MATSPGDLDERHHSGIPRPTAFKFDGITSGHFQSLLLTNIRVQLGFQLTAQPYFLLVALGLTTHYRKNPDVYVFLAPKLAKSYTDLPILALGVSTVKMLGSSTTNTFEHSIGSLGGYTHISLAINDQHIHDVGAVASLLSGSDLCVFHISIITPLAKIATVVSPQHHRHARS